MNISMVAEAYIKMFQNWSDFSGRSRRRDYWLAFLVNFIISAVLNQLIRVVAILYGLIVIVPGLALGIRRLHDIGKSGWWLLISLVPIVGVIVIIVFACYDSGPSNEYEPNPKEM